MSEEIQSQNELLTFDALLEKLDGAKQLLLADLGDLKGKRGNTRKDISTLLSQVQEVNNQIGRVKISLKATNRLAGIAVEAIRGFGPHVGKNTLERYEPLLEEEQRVLRSRQIISEHEMVRHFESNRVKYEEERDWCQTKASDAREYLIRRQQEVRACRWYSFLRKWGLRSASDKALRGMEDWQLKSQQKELELENCLVKIQHHKELCTQCEGEEFSQSASNFPVEKERSLVMVHPLPGVYIAEGEVERSCENISRKYFRLTLWLPPSNDAKYCNSRVDLELPAHLAKKILGKYLQGNEKYFHYDAGRETFPVVAPIVLGDNGSFALAWELGRFQAKPENQQKQW